MNPYDTFIIGFFIGMFSTGVYIFWLISSLKKDGDIIFEITDKTKKRFEEIKEENKKINVQGHNRR